MAKQMQSISKLISEQDELRSKYVGKGPNAWSQRDLVRAHEIEDAIRAYDTERFGV